MPQTQSTSSLRLPPLSDLDGDARAAVRRLRRKAARHADAGRVREALDCQRQVTALTPDDASEFMQLGFLHRQADEIENAVSAFERARSLAPADPDPHAALAEVYLDASRYDDAARESRIVIRLRPGSLPARQILSTAYFQTGQIEKALDVTQEMTRLAPLDPIAHYKTGILHHERGNWRGAQEAFATVMRIAPEGSVEFGEAESAIESLDRQQIAVIMTIADDDRLFLIRLARDAGESSQERGFSLSSDAVTYVQHHARERIAERPANSPLSRPLLYN